MGILAVPNVILVLSTNRIGVVPPLHHPWNFAEVSACATSAVPFLGEQECAFDHVDARLARADDDFDDVETEVHLGTIQQAEPCARAAGDEFLLRTIHGVGGTSRIVARARFYLGEDERVFRDVAEHEVHFAAALCAEIAAENFAAVLAEIALREPFAAASEGMARISGRVPPGEPGEKTGDGLDKAHVA